jgi:hypothetical protein
MDCERLNKIMNQSFQKLEDLETKMNSIVLLQFFDKRIEIEKLKAMETTNYLKSLKMLYKFCNNQTR